MKLHVDPDAKGAVQKPIRISLRLKDKFDEILSKWVVPIQGLQRTLRKSHLDRRRKHKLMIDCI